MISLVGKQIIKEDCCILQQYLIYLPNQFVALQVLCSKKPPSHFYKRSIFVFNIFMKKKLLVVLGLFSAFFTNAQINLVDNQTAQALAQTLVGQGVIMMNPTLNGTCPGTAVGLFTHTGTPLIGIDSGVVLTCGRVINVGGFEIGINAPVAEHASNSFDGPGDPDLFALINENITPPFPIASNDACVLEFDFIPAGDTIKFDYVFASDEYNGENGNYNCSINDVFGFFISGPDYPTPQNIALIPGTNTMVGVSTVNDGTGGSGQPDDPCMANTFGTGPYTEYYNDNPDDPNFVYSGFTDVFAAVAAVIPCDTYHLKLAISDASDWSWDSGVFLKAGSLNSVGITMEEETTYGHNDTIPHCVRGCKSAFVTFNRPSPRPTPLTVKYIIGGDAVNGTDYQQITDSVVIPADMASVDLEIKPLLAPTATGVKDVILQVLSPYNCGNGVPNVLDTAIVRIYDSLYVEIPTTPSTTCPNTEITITADIDTTLNFAWSPAALIPDPLPLTTTIHPKPTVPTTYTITVTMPGAPLTCPPVKRTYLANVEPIPDIILPSRDTTVCYADSVALNVYALPDYTYSYQWMPADYLRDDFSANNKFFAPPGDYKIVIQATTPIANCSSVDSMMIHVVPPFDFISVTPSDTTIKYGDSIQLNSESEAIYWLWMPGTYLSDPMVKMPYASPTENMLYTLIGINEFGCKDTAFVKIDVEYDPKIGMPNAFSPNGDGLNDVFKLQNLNFEKLQSFQIYNRYGQLVFETQNPNIGWDGTIKDVPAAADVYYYFIQYALPDGTRKFFRGDVTLIR